MATAKSRRILIQMLLLAFIVGFAKGDNPNKDVELKAFDKESKTVSVRQAVDKGSVTYKVTDPDLIARLSHLKPGDRLELLTEPNEKEGATITAIVLNQATVPTPMRGEAVALTLAVWLVVGGLLSRWDFLSLIKGEDGRYSNSKFQAVVWFSVIVVVYGATVALRGLRLGIGLMSVNIPQHLLLLSGLSAFTFAAAKGITTAKVQDAQNKGIRNPKGGAGSSGLLVDLTTNDSNQLDLGDFQMLVITLMAVVTYAFIAFNGMGTLAITDTSLKDVDSTILAAFGLGQGAYLTKKAVGSVGES